MHFAWAKLFLIAPPVVVSLERLRLECAGLFGGHRDNLLNPIHDAGEGIQILPSWHDARRQDPLRVHVSAGQQPEDELHIELGLRAPAITG